MCRFIAVVALFAVGLALAAPVPKDEVKLKPATEKERDEVKKKLEQLGIAFHAHHDAIGHFPGDILDAKTKKPLLSWRVELLPYLEEEMLWKQFKLDEPWDSKHNKPLIEKMPKAFAPTRAKAKPGETFYRGFVGAGADAPGVFLPEGKANFATITDGSSNTIGVIDAGEPVVWTKPDTDLDADPKKDLPKLGGMTDGEFYCLMMDGSVKAVKRDFDAKQLRIAVGRNDGFILNANELFADK